MVGESNGKSVLYQHSHIPQSLAMNMKTVERLRLVTWRVNFMNILKCVAFT